MTDELRELYMQMFAIQDKIKELETPQVKVGHVKFHKEKPEPGDGDGCYILEVEGLRDGRYPGVAYDIIKSHDKDEFYSNIEALIHELSKLKRDVQKVLER